MLSYLHFLETVLSASFQKPDHSSRFITEAICLSASPTLTPSLKAQPFNFSSVLVLLP